MIGRISPLCIKRKVPGSKFVQDTHNVIVGKNQEARNKGKRKNKRSTAMCCYTMNVEIMTETALLLNGSNRLSWQQQPHPYRLAIMHHRDILMPRTVSRDGSMTTAYLFQNVNRVLFHLYHITVSIHSCIYAPSLCHFRIQWIKTLCLLCAMQRKKECKGLFLELIPQSSIAAFFSYLVC